MDEELIGLPADIATLIDGGVIDTATARAAGVPRDRLHQLAKAGLLTRLAPGSYALSSATSGFGSGICSGSSRGRLPWRTGQMPT